MLPFLRRPAALALLVGLLTTSAVTAGAGETSGDSGGDVVAAGAGGRPDIVLIVTDDQRPETLDVMPAVQRLLVQNGTRYRRAMVPTSLCCPSRATILTGEYAHTSRVFGNGDVGGGRYGGWRRFHRTGAEERTLAIPLKAAGYRTALVGKYMNFFGKSEIDLGPGFVPPGWDTFTTFMATHGAYYGYRLNDGTIHGSEPQDYSTDVFAGKAVEEILATPDDQPLFLYFAPYGPHKPYTPAPRHVGALAGQVPPYVSPTLRQNRRDQPRWMRARDQVSQAQVDEVRQRQYETMLSVDEAVDSIVSALAERGRDRDTLFVFTSDNGYFWGDHRVIGKDAPYRQSTEVPMVVRWDGRVPAGAVSDRLVLNVDLAETLTRAAGLDMDTDGLDMLGSTRRTGFPLEAMNGYHDRPAYCGWRTRHRMYVRWATGEEEMYDYRSDPKEMRNLAGKPRWRPVKSRMRAHARELCRPLPPGFTWK